MTNSSYMAPGIFISLIGFASMAYGAWQAGGEDSILSFVMGGIFGSVGVTIFLLLGLPVLRQTSCSAAGCMQSCTQGLIGFVFLITFGGFGIFMLVNGSGLFLGLFVVAFIIVNYVFYHLLKAPTQEGRRVLDHIEGFKMYLSFAEKERLNLLNPPEKTPELFEKYLPYALALDVEQKWSEEFAQILQKAGEKGKEYSPSWYSGRSFSNLGAAGFATAVGSSVASAISSSSTAPGSRSGGSGGSSGGGGGGGGGGGW